MQGLINDLKERMKFPWLTLGVLAGLFVSALSYQWLSAPDPVRVEAWEKVAPRLKKAEETTRDDGERAAQDVATFFEESRKGAWVFAEDVLGWSGKWAFVQGYFDSNSHQQYMEGSFRRNVLRPDQLKSVVESAVARYVSEMQGLENKLLVDIRADLQDGDMKAPDRLPALNSELEFRRQYEAMLEQVLPIVSRDLGITVQREMVSFVGSEIAANILMQLGSSVATQLGISGSILGAGASSGLVTFGVGLAAGFLVDMAVDWAMRQAGYDPEGAIARKVCESLNRLERLILNGDAEAHKQFDEAYQEDAWYWSQSDREAARAKAQAIAASGRLGLRHQLKQLNEMRSRLRETALKKLILEGATQ